MELKDIRVGAIYKPKNVGSKCWGYHLLKGRYIAVTGIRGGLEATPRPPLTYKILDKNYNKIGQCQGCLEPEDLEPTGLFDVGPLGNITMSGTAWAENYLHNDHYWYNDPPRFRRLARIKNKRGGFMGVLKKLSTFARKNLDKDVQSFVKLGWLDQDLEITDEGIAQVALYTLMANKADMGKVAADEIKEIEKEEDN